jgi:hypothetical protein
MNSFITPRHLNIILGILFIVGVLFILSIIFIWNTRRLGAEKYGLQFFTGGRFLSLLPGMLCLDGTIGAILSGHAKDFTVVNSFFGAVWFLFWGNVLHENIKQSNDKAFGIRYTLCQLLAALFLLTITILTIAYILGR